MEAKEGTKKENIRNINTLCDYYLKEPQSAESIIEEVKANNNKILVDIPKHSLLSKIMGVFK